MISIIDNDLNCCKDKEASFTFLFYSFMVWTMSEDKTFNSENFRRFRFI